jgi:hypothetical protein
MGRGLGVALGVVALAIPTAVAVAIVAMDAWLAALVLCGLPVSGLMLLASYVLHWRASRGAAGRRPFWPVPTLLTVLTAAAYAVATALISAMPTP